MSYKIGEFSKISELSIDTLRYYEKEGLIVPSRIDGGLRSYSDKDIEWIEFIKRLKLTGMPIKNIKKYAQLRYQGDETIPERLNLLFEQKDELRQEQEVIQEHIKFLDKKIDIYQNFN